MLTLEVANRYQFFPINAALPGSIFSQGAAMKLHWSPRSPFVRKVMIVAHERGVADRIALVRTVVEMTEPHAELMRDNPLSKIPTLVLDDGTVLFDSAVICEYLDALDGTPRLFPRGAKARLTAL